MSKSGNKTNKFWSFSTSKRPSFCRFCNVQVVRQQYQLIDLIDLPNAVQRTRGVQCAAPLDDQNKTHIFPIAWIAYPHPLPTKNGRFHKFRKLGINSEPFSDFYIFFMLISIIEEKISFSFNLISFITHREEIVDVAVQ